jgi:hypothetical protein
MEVSSQRHAPATLSPGKQGSVPICIISLYIYIYTRFVSVKLFSMTCRALTRCMNKLYRVFKEERSVFCEVIVSVILKKNLCEHMSYSERFPIFGAQYFPSLPLYEQSQQPTDASHRFTCFRQWRITAGGKENIARQISETVRNRTHVYINLFFLE